MIEFFLTTLLLLAVGMPFLIIHTEWFRIKGDRFLSLLAVCYAVLAINELVFIYVGTTFYFLHICIDCAAMAILFTALALRNPNRTGNASWFTVAGVLGGLLIISAGIAFLQNPGIGNYLASIVLVAFGAVYGLLYARTSRSRARPMLVLVLLWMLAHTFVVVHYPVVKGVLTLAFFGTLAYVVGRLIFMFHSTIIRENMMLTREHEIVISMLNEISTSEERIRSIDHTLSAILETIVQAIHVEGVAIFQLDSLNPTQPLLRFSQSSGNLYSFFTTTGHAHNGPLHKSELENLCFAYGEGIIGTVAETQKAINWDKEGHCEKMKLHGINTSNVRSIAAAPLTIKKQVLGVVLVENREGEQEFSSADLFFLQSIVDQAASFINNVGIYAELAKVDRIKQEMRIATDIQTQILPKEVPVMAHLKTAMYIKPAREVGGDYYNFFPKQDGTLAIVIGDVSGKGLPASMIVVIAHTALGIVGRTCTGTHDIIVRFSKEMYSKMNRGQFMTLNYLVWNDANRTVSYTGAGHENILHYHAAVGSIEKIKAGGMAVGLIEDPTALVKQREIATQSGDVFVLYTDGMIDARNPTDDLFGIDRLMETVKQNGKNSDPQTISDAIMKTVSEFSNGAEQYDDMTLLVFCVV